MKALVLILGVLMLPATTAFAEEITPAELGKREAIKEQMEDLKTQLRGVLKTFKEMMPTAAAAEEDDRVEELERSMKGVDAILAQISGKEGAPISRAAPKGSPEEIAKRIKELQEGAARADAKGNEAEARKLRMVAIQLEAALRRMAARKAGESPPVTPLRGELAAMLAQLDRQLVTAKKEGNEAAVAELSREIDEIHGVLSSLGEPAEGAREKPAVARREGPRREAMMQIRKLRQGAKKARAAGREDEAEKLIAIAAQLETAMGEKRVVRALEEAETDPITLTTTSLREMLHALEEKLAVAQKEKDGELARELRREMAGIRKMLASLERDRPAAVRGGRPDAVAKRVETLVEAAERAAKAGQPEEAAKLNSIAAMIASAGPRARARPVATEKATCCCAQVRGEIEALRAEIEVLRRKLSARVHE